MSTDITGEMTIEVEISCEVCGSDLKADYTEGSRLTFARLEVSPCVKCLDAAGVGGYDEGHKDGYYERKNNE